MIWDAVRGFATAPAPFGENIYRYSRYLSREAAGSPAAYAKLKEYSSNLHEI
jgi:hypothetical protein